MNELAENKYGTGGLIDRVDSRDYEWSEVGFSQPPFDWDKGYDVEVELAKKVGNPLFKLPVKDQNSSGSCGGQAWATYDSVLEAMITGSFEERSAKYIYAQTYVPGGGSYGRDNAKILVEQGVCRETVLPSYQNGLPPSESFITQGIDITPEARQDAKPSSTVSYSQTGTDIDSIAQAIKCNSGVVIGISGSNNGTWKSDNPRPPKVDEVVWRHWMYFGKAKLINGVKTIIGLNSWGLVGDKGWQSLTEEYTNTRFTINPLTRRVTAVGTGETAIFSGWTHTINPAPTLVFQHHFNTNITYQQSGEEVKALQNVLRLEGFFPLAPTGLYGNITSQAVLQFRQKYGISSATDPFGHSVGPLTRTKLNQLYS
jgi:hypothetical protein